MVQYHQTKKNKKKTRPPRQEVKKHPSVDPQMLVHHVKTSLRPPDYRNWNDLKGLGTEMQKENRGHIHLMFFFFIIDVCG